MAPKVEPKLTELERTVVKVCREVSGYRKPITAETKVNFDLGIAGDDGDELIGELIAATGLAYGPELQAHTYFGSEGFFGDLFDWIRGVRLVPLTVRDLAAGLRNDPALAAEQLAELNAFWRRNWTLPNQGSSSTSQ